MTTCPLDEQKNVIHFLESNECGVSNLSWDTKLKFYFPFYMFTGQSAVFPMEYNRSVSRI